MGYQVEAIVSHKPKYKKLKTGRVLATRPDIAKNGYYETKWLNYDSSENTWEIGKKLEKTVGYTIEMYWRRLEEKNTENRRVYKINFHVFLTHIFSFFLELSCHHL